MKDLIPSLVCNGAETWYFRNHKPVSYAGDALNTAKILSDAEVPEIAINNVSCDVGEDILLLPKYVARPITFHGGISGLHDAELILRRGFDRIGLTIKTQQDVAKLTEYVSAFGTSTIIVNIKYNSPDDYSHIQDVVTELPPVSEIILHNVTRAGTLKGIDLALHSRINKLSPHNLAISGGFCGDQISSPIRIYYSTHFMFPLVQRNLDHQNPDSLLVKPAQIGSTACAM